MATKHLAVGVCAMVLALQASGQARQTSSTCTALTALTLPNVRITLAELVPADALNLPTGATEASRALPAFCRVMATLTPSADSKIAIEVWMPAAGWNGKLQAVGNGAFSGAIAYPAMMTALARGYATASTDTGHTGGSASFGLGRPEKIVDFGWRAVHEMTVTAKAIIAAFYERRLEFSFWNGCSAAAIPERELEPKRIESGDDGFRGGWSSRGPPASRSPQSSRDSRARSWRFRPAWLVSVEAVA